MKRPTLLEDRIDVRLPDGEEVTVWNNPTVYESHNVGPTSIEHHHLIHAGDGSTEERPDYITPEMDDQLRALDVYPNAEVVDPADEEVTIL